MTTTARAMKSHLRFEVKDAALGLVEAVFAHFNVKDFDDDLTLPSAFENGAKVLISAYGHATWYGAMPVGRGTIRVEEDKAVLVGEFFLNTTAGRDTFEVVKGTGELQEWSYGYDVLKTGEITEPMRQAGVRRVLEKLKVYEVSPVMVGAGVDTETLSVKAAAAPPAPAPVVDVVPEWAAKAREEFARFERTRGQLIVADTW